MLQAGIPTFVALAAVIPMNRCRLSMIVNGWITPTADERRAIAAVLRRRPSRIFPKDQPSAGVDDVKAAS